MRFLAFSALERVSVQQIDTGFKSDNDSTEHPHAQYAQDDFAAELARSGIRCRVME